MVPDKAVAEIIKELNLIDETDSVDAKEISKNELGSSVYETICALCNEPDLGGGTILLGVAKEEALFPFYKVTGISDPDKVSSDLASGCRSIFNQTISPRITTHKVDGRVVVRVDVPEVERALKPIYFKSKGIERGTFRRIGPSDVKCSLEDLESLFRQKSSQAYDASIVQSATLADIDPEALDTYRKLRREANTLAEELMWSDDDLLFALGAISREGDSLKPTVSGLVCFGRQAALRRIFPSLRVDYVRVTGRTWIGNQEGKFDALEMRGPVIASFPE